MSDRDPLPHDQPPLPIIGQEDWGDDLNTYLNALDSRLTVLENLPPPPTSRQGEWNLVSTNTAPPASNQIRSNSGLDLKSATHVWLANVSNAGIDWTNLWSLLPTTGTIEMYIQKKNDATKWVKLTAVTPLSQQTGYVDFTVSYLDDGGAAFTTGPVMIVFRW